MQGRSAAIDILRVISVFAVIWLHISAALIEGSSYGEHDWWVGFTYDSLSRWCVPVFVMISGMLLLSKPVHEDISGFYRKRASRILIPVLVWSVFYSCWDLIWGRGFNLEQSIEQIIQGVPFYHLWFVYMLAGLYFVTPFVTAMFEKIGVKTLLLASIFLFVAAFADDIAGQFWGDGTPTFLMKWIPYLPYFILGKILGDRLVGHDVQINLLNFVIIFLAASVGIIGLGGILVPRMAGDGAFDIVFSDQNPLVVIQAICVFCAVILFCQRRIKRSRPWVTRWADLTFGIYLVHPIIINGFREFGGEPSSLPSAVAVLLLAPVAFMASLGLARLISLIPYLRRTI